MPQKHDKLSHLKDLVVVVLHCCTTLNWVDVSFVIQQGNFVTYLAKGKLETGKLLKLNKSMNEYNLLSVELINNVLFFTL